MVVGHLASTRPEDFGTQVLRSPGGVCLVSPAELYGVQELHCKCTVKFGDLKKNPYFANI